MHTSFLVLRFQLGARKLLLSRETNVPPTKCRAYLDGTERTASHPKDAQIKEERIQRLRYFIFGLPLQLSAGSCHQKIPEKMKDEPGHHSESLPIILRLIST